MAFRNHLRTEKNVIFAACKSLQDPIMCKLRSRSVLIHPDYFGFRQKLGKLLFKFLRPGAEEADITAAASRTNIRRRMVGLAIVALQPASCLMINEGNIAFFASHHMPAFAAQDESGMTTPVKQ